METITFRLQPKYIKKLKSEPSINRRFNNQSEILRVLVTLYLEEENMQELTHRLAKIKILLEEKFVYTLRVVTFKVRPEIAEKLDADGNLHGKFDNKSHLIRTLVILFFDEQRMKTMVYSLMAIRYDNLMNQEMI